MNEIKRVLLNSLYMWQDILENEYECKYDSTLAKGLLHHCHCCQHTYKMMLENKEKVHYHGDTENPKLMCNKYCPMYSYWRMDAHDNNDDYCGEYPCEADPSPYEQLENSNSSEESMECVEEIILLFNLALEDLKDENE